MISALRKEKEKGGNRATDRSEKKSPWKSPQESLEGRRANLRTVTKTGRALPTSTGSGYKGSSGRACKQPLKVNLLASLPGQEPTLGRNYWDRNQQLSKVEITEERDKVQLKTGNGDGVRKSQTASHLPFSRCMRTAEEWVWNEKSRPELGLPLELQENQFHTKISKSKYQGQIPHKVITRKKKIKSRITL